MRGKKGKSKISITKYLPVLIILLSITIIVGSTFAYFTDKKDAQSDLTFSKVELSSETTVGVNGELRDVIPGSKLVDGAVEFSKAIDSEAIYVRAKISFSLPSVYKDDTAMQEIIDKLRSSTDFNIVSDEQAGGAVWSQKQGNYFYLVTKADNALLMKVDTIDTYTLSNEVVVPRDLESLENNSQYMKSINFHIAFEAIQADNVSNVLAETKAVFTQLFPESEGEKYVPEVEEPTGIVINVHSSDLTSVIDTIVLTEAGTIEEPTIELEDGKVLEGWYSDSALTTRFDFTQVVSENVSLYPNVLSVSENLAYTPIYATATTNNSPDFTQRNEGEIIGYSVALGTCEDTVVVIPESYEGKPVTEITQNGFYNNNNLVQVILPETITKINDGAFKYSANLVSVNIPSSVRSIGGYAFWDCTALSGSIIIPEGVTEIKTYTFSGCNNIQKLSLPSTITSLASSSFSYLKALTELEYNVTSLADLSTSNSVFSLLGTSGEGLTIRIGANVERIPAYLFDPNNSTEMNLYKVKEIIFEGENCTSIGDYAFSKCEGLTSLHIPASVTSIGVGILANNTTLETVTVSEGSSKYVVESGCLIDNDTRTLLVGTAGDVELDNITTIGDYAFGFKNLNSITITSGLTTLGKGAFADSKITNYTFPESLANVGQYAFYRCRELTTVSIPKGVTSIGVNAFCAVTKVTSIYFNAESLADIEAYSYVFDLAGTTGDGINVTIGKDAQRVPASLFNATSGSYAKILSLDFEENAICSSIGNYAFMYNPNLQTVVIPSSITSIGESAFYSCPKLNSVTLHASNVTVGSTAFAKASNLQNASNVDVIIGADVTKIPNAIFALANVQSITYLGNKVEEIGTSAFQNSLLTTVTIPASVKIIGERAFTYSSVLETINIPNGVTTIKKYAFQNCYKVKTINFDANITTAVNSGDYIFSACGYSTTDTVLNIGANVTSIPDYMFKGADCIDTMIFADNSTCTSIGRYAFDGCNQMYTVKLPTTTITYGSYPFAYNTRYILCENATIGESVKGKGTEYTSIYVLATTGYENVTFTEAVNGTISISTGTDASGYTWVKATGDKYYKCIVTA